MAAANDVINPLVLVRLRRQHLLFRLHPQVNLTLFGEDGGRLGALFSFRLTCGAAQFSLPLPVGAVVRRIPCLGGFISPLWIFCGCDLHHPFGVPTALAGKQLTQKPLRHRYNFS